MDPALEPTSNAAPTSKRRLGVLLAVVLLVVVGVSMTFAAAGRQPSPTEATFNAASTTAPPPSTVAPTTSTTSTTSTTTSTTTTLWQQQTRPIAPPQDARAPEDLGQLGSIAIPKLGLDVSMYEGIRLTTLDRGPGHWPGSAMPGQIGNVVVAGHRTSHGAQFRKIDQLAPGDLVTFTTADGVFDYEVVGTEIVEPDDLWIIDPSDTATATLFACHPPGSIRQRIVVHLALAGG